MSAVSAFDKFFNVEDGSAVAHKIETRRDSPSLLIRTRFPYAIGVTATEKLNFESDLSKTANFLTAINRISKNPIDVISDALGKAKPKRLRSNPVRLIVSLRQVRSISPEVAMFMRAQVEKINECTAISSGWLQPLHNEAIRALNAVGFHWRADIIPSPPMEIVRKLAVSNHVICSGGGAHFLVSAEAGDDRSPEAQLRVLIKHFPGVVRAAVPALSDGEFERIRVPVQTVMSEALHNINKYAYAGLRTHDKPDHMWWFGVFGVRDDGRISVKKADSLIVSVCDVGVSITESLRKKLDMGTLAFVADPLVESTSKEMQLSDHRILQRLMESKILNLQTRRLSTGMSEFRGLVDSEIADSVAIVSGSAVYQYSKKKHGLEGLDVSFPGTIISWRLPLSLKR